MEPNPPPASTNSHGCDDAPWRQAEESLRLQESRLNWLLELSQKASELDEREIVQQTLKEVVRLIGSEIGYLLICRKRAEDALQAHVQALEEAARQKDRFLAMLGHELRTPLAPVRSALEILEHPESCPEAVARATKILARQVAHMTRLVDDLLEVSQIVHGKTEFQAQRVDLAEILREALEVHESLIRSRRQQLAIASSETPLFVRGDRVRLNQIVGNLLNNAAKYTSEGGKIKVLLSSEGREAVVRIEDSGIGIPQHMLLPVFEPFTRGDHQQVRAQRGLGIGLTLVRHLVELHGGTIEVFSLGENQGSQFVVRFPLDDEMRTNRKRLPRTAKQTPRAAVSRRILLVDDNVDTACLLAELLGMNGHEVKIAHDGPAALAAAEAFQPEAVLLDIGLPEIDGYEVARRFREKHRDASTILIALTGHGHEEAVRRSREAGFDHHLVKPVRSQAIEELLASSRPRR